MLNALIDLSRIKLKLKLKFKSLKVFVNLQLFISCFEELIFKFTLSYFFCQMTAFIVFSSAIC